MSNTLHNQMDEIFNNGFEIIRTHKQAIIDEWNTILLHLRKAGKSSGKSVEDTITYLSEFFFNSSNDNKRNVKSLTSNSTIQTNPFIMTLLENAVHKVIQANHRYSYHEHQAIQYLFSNISEQILTSSDQHRFEIEHFLKHLVTSQQLPIEWAAKVHGNRNQYTVEKWFHQDDDEMLFNYLPIEQNSIYSLTEAILKQLPKKEQQCLNVIPIPYQDYTLLICITQKESSHIVSFLTYSLQIFQDGLHSIKDANEKQKWKDSVIMFNETIMRAQTYSEAVEYITAGFVRYLPFERCALFSYSLNEQMGFGLFGHQLDNSAIQNITEDIQNLPIIQNNLQILQLFGQNMNYLQPVYIEDAMMGFPKEYVEQFELNSVVVAPIFTTSTSKLLGAAILDQGPGQSFEISEKTFSALIKFGQSAGEILAKYDKPHLEQPKPSLSLSPREIEVLKLMAEGASTSEAADELNLSEYTVRDYVSAIMQKMKARNRTEAVARAIREGLI
ncbi:response regulator transcription factor [Salinibacillus xinjiangensis]|uniref:DNA-binding response regulator n=1 Tax=Salinibacillus xinjiangensis TaxID=1229268 RepID=A0A6G1X6J3_9BACI|nr:response regulator transcription factor [Salinibacillus xinjiangensis]MRG86525.1 DNA-binding response regulator [Salinibacillus xinjiangensis]